MPVRENAEVHPAPHQTQKEPERREVPKLREATVTQDPGAPKNATATILIEGLPVDATEREVAHIFRPFAGFKAVRIIENQGTVQSQRVDSDQSSPLLEKGSLKEFVCYVDFENPVQSTAALGALQVS